MFGISAKSKNDVKVEWIPVGNIRPNPHQPRKTFDSESLLGLAESIKQNGILQPLTVRMQSGGQYELVAGERRLRAAMIAGLSQVPCIAMKMDDRQSTVLAMLENLQREDLNFFEEAEGIARLIETWSLTQDEIASRLGKSQSAVANKLRLLRISAWERVKILDAGLTERHARALLRVPDEHRREALELIVQRGLNVAETDRLVELYAQPREGSKKQTRFPVVKDVRLFLNTISNAINVMRESGIDAVAVKQECEDYFEYTVRIPKYAKAKRAG